MANSILCAKMTGVSIAAERLVAGNRLRKGAALRSPACTLRNRRGELLRRRATATRLAELEEEVIEEDFYSLLGVSPAASNKEIKRAYYSMMRTCHPDRSDDNEANDFCALLNEVYETLTDPNCRALYDELAGFSIESVNPFLDDRYPQDRVFVDEFSCIGCRNCNHVCPRTFAMEEDFGRARAMAQDVDNEAKLQEAIDSCPVSCIHWVSGPQLSLLETAMARIERIPVWSMMGGAGANKDVFTEASLAWTRRQADIRERVAAATDPGSGSGFGPESTGWAFWNNVVSFGGATGSRVYQDADQARQKQQQQQQQASSSSGTGGGGGAGGVRGDREGRSVADLAARAARLARTWRRFQESASESRRERLALSTSSSSMSTSMDE